MLSTHIPDPRRAKQHAKKKEYLSLMGTVDDVLPFTQDMHGTTIT